MQNNQQYAKTLFELGQKANCISMLQSQLKALQYLFNKVPAFRLVLITKRLDNQNKINIVRNTLTMFDALILEFISIIINNNQINNLLNIISRFNRLVHTNSSIQEVDIITAQKLSDEDIIHLSESINKKLDFNPKINILHDQQIIGGVKLRIGNKIFDNSVAYQIKQLKKTLHNM